MLKHCSLDSLLAFETVSRLKSFSKAAAELNLTQPTISYRIKRLEDLIGKPLFERSSSGLSWTQSGHNLFQSVAPLLDDLAKALESEANSRNVEQVSVTTSPAFSAIWLVPRLQDFLIKHPHIEVSITATDRYMDLFTEADLAIRPISHNRSQPSANIRILPFTKDQEFAVCSPRIIKAGTFNEHSPLVDQVTTPVLLHDETKSIWAKYLQNIGLDGTQLRDGPIFSNADLTLKAAISGLGVAFARSSYTKEMIEAGLLAKLSLPSVPATDDYIIACSNKAYARPGPKTFIDWMIEQQL
jgi:LysR family glycine cleavage system transcriptional activator